MRNILSITLNIVKDDMLFDLPIVVKVTRKTSSNMITMTYVIDVYISDFFFTPLEEKLLSTWFLMCYIQSSRLRVMCLLERFMSYLTKK